MKKVGFCCVSFFQFSARTNDKIRLDKIKCQEKNVLILISSKSVSFRSNKKRMRGASGEQFSISANFTEGTRHSTPKIILILQLIPKTVPTEASEVDSFRIWMTQQSTDCLARIQRFFSWIQPESVDVNPWAQKALWHLLPFVNVFKYQFTIFKLLSRTLKCWNMEDLLNTNKFQVVYQYTAVSTLPIKVLEHFFESLNRMP